MTPEEEIQRAERAKQILEDPFVSEALSALEQAAINKLKLTVDDHARLRLVDFMQAADLFRQYFVSHIETGKLAQAKLLQDSTMDKVRRVFR